jgi:hypothetical protein
MRFATIEERDRVAACSCGIDNVRSDEAGATEDQDLFGGVAVAKMFGHDGSADRNGDSVGMFAAVNASIQLMPLFFLNPMRWTKFVMASLGSSDSKRSLSIVGRGATRDNTGVC